MAGTLLRIRAALGLLGLALLISGCSAQYSNHGYVPPESDLEELVVGVDTRATVDDQIGAPSASGLLSGGDYYYVRSRFRERGMFAPEVIDRQIVAISFDDTDTIANIERFGLEDGRPVRLSRRVTDSSVVGKGFLRQLLGNIGNFDLGQALD
ncbi:outer membrane protein assembly factor BamE [Roseovarius salinarum]|uniref:outer membrane protein assembly factor BamE n=1 Tax=Roseovarius salinarum TaxID=1981892 RepID=UPI000C335227|nr:outer membrane protein assembly factor BamE [Roseovarius salinarum]